MGGSLWVVSELAVDPGVRAPTGSPGGLAAAAGWHASLADYFENTASTVEYAAGSLAGTNWDGEAARSYGALAVLVGAHFRAAGATARTAADTLWRYAHELEQLQQQGVHAVDQTVHWLGQEQRDQLTLTAAQTALSDAQGTVSRLQGDLAIAHPGPQASAMAGALTTAQGALSEAESAVRRAQKALEDDGHQVQIWQQRARQIWQEAENAAAVATWSLEPLAVAPPPLAGAPATFTDALAADAPFLRAHSELAGPLAQQIAQRNANRNHLDHAAVSTDQRRVLAALDSGQNLDGVPLSQPHRGGGWLLDALAAGAVGVTELVGGGPEDPAADGLSALEVTAIEGGGDAAAAASAGSEATAASDAARTMVGVDRGDGRDVLGQFAGGTRYGANAEAEGLNQYAEETGDPVIAAHVRSTLPDGSTRYYDGLTPNGDGTYTGIEIKSNSASLSPKQRAFDGAVDSGQAATATLDGRPIRVTRVVYRQVTQ